MAGLTRKEIENVMGLSVAGVRDSLANARWKFGAGNDVHLVAILMRARILV
jgi:DNA-binding CsgD family transcriptional regulator